MFTQFNNLPDNARIWIYQSDREFSGAEMKLISAKLSAFTETWKSHGKDVKASFLIKYNRFIIIAADIEFNDVSGCSIDASVHFIKTLEKELESSLLNKLNIAYKEGEGIKVASLIEFKSMVAKNKLTPQTIVFDNLTNSKIDFETKWEIPASKISYL